MKIRNSLSLTRAPFLSWIVCIAAIILRNFRFRRNSLLYSLLASHNPFIADVHSLKAASPLCWQGRLLSAIFLCLFFQTSYLARIEATPPIRFTLLLSELLLIALYSTQRMVGLTAHRSMPPSRKADAMFSLPDVLFGFLPETCNSFAFGGRIGPYVYKSAAICFASTFSRPLCLKSPYRFSLPKLVCRRVRPGRADNGVVAQIFLYRACGLGLYPKIKSISALSLVPPFTASTFYAP